jgi:hypothetical protein
LARKNAVFHREGPTNRIGRLFICTRIAEPGNVFESHKENGTIIAQTQTQYNVSTPVELLVERFVWQTIHRSPTVS